MVGSVFSRVGQVAVPQLSDIIANSLIDGRKINMIFDFDGTLFPFCDDPTNVKIDEKCRQALLGLSSKENIGIFGLTGRDLSTAQSMLGDIEIPIVGSHGAEFATKDGYVKKYPFTEEQLHHIQEAQKQVHILTHQFPDLHIEVNKFGSIGINLSRYVGQENVRDAVFSAIEKFQNESFSIAYEGRKENDLGWEIELRPAEHICGKHIGITNFIKPDRAALNIFVGDSFGDHGTDTPAAILINNKHEFPNGVVVMVMNGRNKVPKEDSPQSPTYIMQSPADLGDQLIKAITDANNFHHSVHHGANGQTFLSRDLV